MLITYRYLKKKYDQRQRPPPDADVEAPAQPHSQATAPEAAVNGEEKRETDSQSSPPTVQPKTGKGSLKWTILLTAGLAIPVFLETLDYTVVATAQSHIASVFNRLDLQSYIGTIYLLTSTVFLPLFASFADVFGRHWTLQISLFLFMIGSAISTGAMNMPTMLAGRGVAGAGAAGVLAAVRIILTDTRSLEANSWQQGIMFLLYTIGFCLGPFIGGELVAVSFRWVFAINLPCAALAMVIAFFTLRGRIQGGEVASELPNSARTKDTFFSKFFRIDWVGALIFMASGILLLLALNSGSTDGWSSAKVIACFVVGGVLIIPFFLWEWLLEHKATQPETSFTYAHTTRPMIPLELFRSFQLCVVQFATFVGGVIMLVMFYFVAIYAVIVTGYSPSKAGAQLIYFAPGMGGGSIIAIQMIRRLKQPKWPIMLGSFIYTIALGLISMGIKDGKIGEVNGFMAMSGVGVGMSIGPLAVHARFSQPEERNAIVSALSLFFRSFGGTVGLAQCGAVLDAKVKHIITQAILAGDISQADIQAFGSAASNGLDSINSISSLSDQGQQLVKNAYAEGTRWCFISLIPWAAVAAILTLFLSNIQTGEKGQLLQVHEVHEKPVKSHSEDESAPASPDMRA